MFSSFSDDPGSQAAALSRVMIRTYGANAAATAEKHLISAEALRDQPMIDLWRSVQALAAA